MKISELIKRAQKDYEIFGDIECIDDLVKPINHASAEKTDNEHPAVFRVCHFYSYEEKEIIKKNIVCPCMKMLKLENKKKYKVEQ